MLLLALLKLAGASAPRPIPAAVRTSMLPHEHTRAVTRAVILPSLRPGSHCHGLCLNPPPPPHPARAVISTVVQCSDWAIEASQLIAAFLSKSRGASA